MQCKIVINNNNVDSDGDAEKIQVHTTQNNNIIITYKYEKKNKKKNYNFQLACMDCKKSTLGQIAALRNWSMLLPIRQQNWLPSTEFYTKPEPIFTQKTIRHISVVILQIVNT